MARRCTTAYARSRRTRRRFNLLVSTMLAAFVMITGPSFMASTTSAFDRYVIAEAAGDTAQNIAIKVGREISVDTERPATLSVVRGSGDDCVVAEVGIAVSCEAKVKIRYSDDGSFRVIAKRHGERFVYSDSTGA